LAIGTKSSPHVPHLTFARSCVRGRLMCLRALSSTCGYYLADRGTDLRTMQDYLGHRDPRHTVRYSRIAGQRFEGLWK
jgi:hypothetical protein